MRIIRNFALMLGVISLVNSHWRKISRKQSGFGYSILVFVSFFAMTFCGLIWGIDAPRDLTLPLEVPAEIMQKGGEFKTESMSRRLTRLHIRSRPRQRRRQRRCGPGWARARNRNSNRTSQYVLGKKAL
jgi:hypothetical protein